MPIISDGNNRTGDELSDKHTTIGTTEHTGSYILSGPDGTVLDVNDGLLFVTSSNRVGIGTTTPSAELDVDGEIRFTESGFGAAFAFGGVPKYLIRELNDVLWRADLRCGSSLADPHNSTGEMIFYPLNDHGETTSVVSSSTTVRSLTDSSASTAGIALGDAGASTDVFIAETSYVEMPTVISGGALVENATRKDLPSQIFDGFWSNRIDLKHSTTHEFVVNLRTIKGFPAGGLSYGEGSIYIGFFNGHVNFDSVKVETFHLQGTTTSSVRTTGRWVQRGATITSVSDDRNITRTAGYGLFKIDFDAANYNSRPVINQRTGEVLSATAGRQLDYYVSAVRITVVAGALPLSEGQTPVQYYQANGDSVPDNQRCSLSDIAMVFHRRNSGLPTSFFNKFDDTTRLAGAISFPSGSTASPPLTFKSQENTGFYMPTTGKVSTSIAGSQVTTTTSTGLGIGTDDPSALLHLASTTTDDMLFLQTTEDSNSASPIIKLKRNSSSPADADYLGQLKFQGENDADQNVTYAKITGKIGSVTDGSEQGIIEFANMKNGSTGITARLKHDSFQLLNDTNLSVSGVVKLDVQSSDPNNSADSAHIYAKDSGSSAEIFVRDEAGNVTQISPHNSEGEWQYFSRNTRTGKVVKVNMEKMIRRLEEITGESFMEEWYEDPDE